jgi:UDP-2,3-diacylglucosamine pyrophosphatase LpxH
MKKAFISDLHLGDKGKADDFRRNEHALMEFLNTLDDGQLVLVGDVFDLWENSLDDIIRAYGGLIDLLFRKACAYVAGNHDMAMMHYGSWHKRQPVEKLIINGTLVMHGHQFDEMNATGHSVGRYITGAVAWLQENVWSGIDIPLRGMERFIRRQGRFGRPQDYRKAGLQYIDRFRVNSDRVKAIVMGHTHQKDCIASEQLAYYNTGCWINGNQDITWIEV